MRCFACHIQWNLSAKDASHLRACPVCGRTLAAEPDLETLQGVLSHIAYEHGKSALMEGKALLAHFSRTAPRMAREKLLLAGLVSCGGHAILTESADLDQVAQLYVAESVSSLLVSQGFFSQAAAKRSVAAFLQAAACLYPTQDACEDGEAYFRKGLDFLSGVHERAGLIPNNRRRGIHYIRLAADLGHALAQTMIADRYRAGFDTLEENAAAAAHYYRLAADQGYAEAQVSLAFLYDTGEGVDHSEEQYFSWMYKAASQAHPAAMLFLGCALANGTGTQPNPEQAEYWLSKAAAQTEDPDVSLWAQGELEKLQTCL